MLYICIFSNKFDLKQTIRVLHSKLDHFINISKICCVALKRSSLHESVSKFTQKKIFMRMTPAYYCTVKITAASSFIVQARFSITIIKKYCGKNWRLQSQKWEGISCQFLPPGPHVIKLFTVVIYCYSMVILSFCVIKQHYLCYNCRMARNIYNIEFSLEWRWITVVWQ